MRPATFHHPYTTIENWYAFAIQINVAKADLATKGGYLRNMFALGGRPRLLPTALGEVANGDTLTPMSRAPNVDEEPRLLLECQWAGSNHRSEYSFKQKT